MMNDDIARALVELTVTLGRAVDSIAADPQKNADYLILLIGAIESAVENYDNNTYEESDRELVRSFIDLATAEAASSVIVLGTVVILAPAAGAVAIAVSSFAVGALLSSWLESNRISFYPSVQDAQNSNDPVTLYGYQLTGDTLVSSIFGDRVFGFGGNDLIENSGGSDLISGGDGYDQLSYANLSSISSSGIVVDARNGNEQWSIFHSGSVDSVSGVEVITGTSAADTFVVDNSGANSVFNSFLRVAIGGAGDDVFVLHNNGAQGPRQLELNGGAHTLGDTLVIGDEDFATQIDLSEGTARYNGGANAAFKVNGFENILGGEENDFFTGNSSDNYLFGGGGSDRLSGGAGDDVLEFFGNAILDGGSGFDIVRYQLKDTGASIDLSARDIEVVVAGGGNDTLSSDGSGTRLLSGGGGNDTFNVSVTGASPTIIWGGEGADKIDLIPNPDSSTAPGILVVNASNLTEENFHLFDLEKLGLGSQFDWSKIDVVLLNPDTQDKISIGGQTIGTRYDDPFGAPRAEYAYIGEGPGDGGFAIAGTTSVTFLGGGARDIFTGVSYPIVELHVEYIDGNGIHFLDTEVYPDEESGNWVFYKEDGSVDFTLVPGSHYEAMPWTPANSTTGEPAQRGLAWYRGERYIDIDSAGDVLGWFIVGGSVDGTEVDDDGSITITMPNPSDPDSEQNPRGGSYGYAPDATSLSGGEGTTLITGYDAAKDAVVIGGNVINAQTLGGNVTARETSLGTIITYGEDDNVVLRGVTLAQWQAGAAQQIHGTSASEIVNGTTGANVIVSGGGNDTIIAGAGDDRIIYTSGNDVIVGNATYNSGFDTLDLGRFKASDVHFSFSGWDILVITPDGTIRLDYQARYDIGDVKSNIERIVFSDGTLDERAIRDRMVSDQSTSGNDSIFGSAYADVIDGLAGNDTITANSGDDRIGYTSGDDVIVGNATKNRGLDTLDLSQYRAADVRFTVSGWDVLITTVAGTIRLEYQIRNAVGNIDSNIESILFSDGALNEAGISARATGDQATVGNDNILGTAYADNINGLEGNDTITAGSGNDTLFGGAGNDSLDGGVGIDSLVGGTGDDTYIVDVAGDVLVELASEGNDLVVSSLSWTLADNFEFLSLSGSTAINGTGNGAANILTGNIAANTLSGLGGNDTIVGGSGNDTLLGGDGDDSLDGGAGTDSMAGGLGDDTYVIDAATDIIIEAASGGTDTVRTSLAWTLGANVERLVQTGTAAAAGTGNALANSMTGNGAANNLSGLDGNDTLIGAGGNDSLTGGNGADQFVFNSTASGVDIILDFNELNGGGEEGDVLRFEGLSVGAFAYRGTAAFTGGSDNSEARVSGTQVLVDTNGDGITDITMTLTGLTSASQLAASDFIFV
jgi:trimeric autotransporter adhesin